MVQEDNNVCATTDILSSHSDNIDVSQPRMLQMELVVSNVLRYGVAASFAIVALGAALLLESLHVGERNSSFAALMPSGQDSVQVPRSIADVLHGLLAGDPNAVISLGLLVLLATPILRVVVSVLVFLLERDRLYVAITLFVLAMLAVSFLVGTAG